MTISFPEGHAASRPQDEKRKDDSDDSVTEPLVGTSQSESKKAVIKEKREGKPSGKEFNAEQSHLCPRPVHDRHVPNPETYPPPPLTYQFPDDFSQEEYDSLFPSNDRPGVPVPICGTCGAEGVRKTCTFWNERLGQTYWACPVESDPYSGLNKIICFEDEYVGEEYNEYDGDEFHDELGNYIYGYCGQDDVPRS
ncbi:hypothetical protein KEM55_001071 [Ascosphaera atra]|nr:hypothetical protein KEM55_001071 [Ascosphaera atra]